MVTDPRGASSPLVDPIPEANAARGTRRAEQILRESTRLFRESGYQNISLEEIGAAVGLTGPAVYRHFKGKQDILAQTLLGQVEAVETIAARAATQTEPVEADAGSTVGRRLATFLNEIGRLAATGDDAMLWRREQRHLEPTQRKAFRVRLGRAVHDLQGTVAAARCDLSEDQAELLAFATLSMYANSREIGSGLSAEELFSVQASLGRSIVTTGLSASAASADPAPVSAWRPAGRRERIIHAAGDLFDRRGYYDVHIEEIARTAGMSVTTLYQHFGAKSEILRTVVSRAAEGLLYVTAEALASTTTAEEVLRTLIDSYIAQALGPHGRTMRILVSDAIYLDESTQHALRATQREYVTEWAEAIRRVRPELTAVVAQASAQAAIGVITDLSQTRRVRARPQVVTELRELASTMVLASS